MPDTKRPPREYCSEQAPGGSMLGTAEQVDAWLLLEYKPSWAAKAIADGGLSAATRAWLSDTAQRFAQHGLALRPQLVRQPERDSDKTRVLLSCQGQLWRFEGVGYDYLQDLDLASLVVNAAAPTAAEPLFFVCTNGKRDLCCARFGLPLYQRLRELVGDRVWQVTHLGGHRFAPNLLVVPDNVIYGRVAVDELVSFVAQVERHELDFRYLRGRTAYPQAVQAAEGLLQQQHLDFVGIDSDASLPGQPIRVDFTAADSPVSVALQRADQPLKVQGSCGDEQAKDYYPFEMLG